jgi:hypothetical protein
MTRPIRRTFAALLVLLAMGLMAASASAAPPVNETTTTKAATDTFVDVLAPCDENAPLYEITVDYNQVEHTTAFDDGRVHSTFTQTGTFVAKALEPGSLDATGKFTIWGGFNQNGKSVNGTFTFNLNGTYSDGTKVGAHVNSHFNATPTGAEFFFDHCGDR